jgi:translation elongation factor EF-G
MHSSANLGCECTHCVSVAAAAPVLLEPIMDLEVWMHRV